jgi:hypothetical protein
LDDEEFDEEDDISGSKSGFSGGPEGEGEIRNSFVIVLFLFFLLNFHFFPPLLPPLKKKNRYCPAMNIVELSSSILALTVKEVFDLIRPFAFTRYHEVEGINVLPKNANEEPEIEGEVVMDEEGEKTEDE